MNRQVLLSGQAEKTYLALDEASRRRIRDALLALAATGRGDIKKLQGTKGRADLFRLRVGDLRIVFELSTDEIRVTRIIPRSEGYGWL